MEGIWIRREYKIRQMIWIKNEMKMEVRENEKE